MGNSRTVSFAVAVVSAVTAFFLFKKKQRSPYSDDDDDAIIVELNETENLLYMRGDPPITTLTWFRGDYQQQAIPFLRSRTRRILESNPWLCGSAYKQSGRLLLRYPKKGDFEVDEFFLVVDLEQSVLSRDTPIQDLRMKICKKSSHTALLLTNGPNEPLFRVTLMPCQTNPHSHFCVIVAMSHFVGDGHTYYRILNMLCSDDDKGAVICPLSARRVPSATQQQRQALGAVESDWSRSIGFLFNAVYGMFQRKVLGRATRDFFVMLDTKKIQDWKRKAAKESGLPFVSTNDVLTSWFLQNVPCQYGFMAINFRSRLPNFTEDLAGNYEDVIFYRRRDTKTPALIRQSLMNFRRSVTTAERMPSFWQTFTANIALVTSWATVAKPSVIPGCVEELHVPLSNVADVIPSTLVVCIIFRSGPGTLGLYICGTPDKIETLKKPPFCANEPIC